MMALSNRLPFRLMKPASVFSGLATGLDDLGILVVDVRAVLAHRLAVDGQRIGMRQQARLHQFDDHRRHAAGMVIVLAEIFAGRLQVDQQRHLVADLLPVVIVELDAEMAGDGVEVDRRIGRAADRRIDDDGVLESLARHDVGRLQILVHHVDDALAGLIGDLAALAVGRGDGGRARQLHAERLGQRVHRRRRAHRVAVADRRRGGGDDVHELVVVDLAGRQALRAISRRWCPSRCARPCASR